MPESEGAGSLPAYRIFETRQFLRDLEGLGAASRERLEGKIRDYVYPLLRENPHSGPNIKRLKNWKPATWRYRVGDWRYKIDEKNRVVYMTAADYRKSADR